MKKILFILLFAVFISSFPAQAFASTVSGVEYGSSPYYTETTISNAVFPLDPFIMPQSAGHTITKTKTTKVKASDGTVLWSVSITASFTYDGATAYCNTCSHSATAYGERWFIKSVSSAKTGNQATAAAVATHHGSHSQDFTQSVTIKCSKNGTVS